MDKHGGKKVVGYWEDGLAIYEDGSREEKEVEEDSDDGVVKAEQDGWGQERFGGHTDAKPLGDKSMGFDVTFVESKALIGLAEHATGAALPDTKGDGARYKDPYRLYNLDVFEVRK